MSEREPTDQNLKKTISRDTSSESGFNLITDKNILREKAVELAEKKISQLTSPLTEEDTKKLIHELKVHQLELELQNEELVLAKEMADIATQKFSELYDFAPCGYFTLSDQAQIIDLNLRGSAMLGRERLFLKNRSFYLFVTDRTKTSFSLFLANIFSKNTKQSCEVVLSVKGKPPMDVQLNGIISGNNEQCLMTAVDITEHNRAEKEIRESERFLKDTQIIARLGTYSMDVVSGRWTSSEVLDAIFGIETDYDKTVEGWNLIIHPQWQKLMSDYLEREVIGKKKPFNKEYKIIRKSDHSERWVHGIGRLEFNKKNQTVRMVGTIRDITESKLGEEALKKSELLLKSSIESQKDTMLLSIDLNYQYLYFNRAHHDFMRNIYETDIKVGQDILSCITSHNDRELARENYERAFKGESHSNECQFGKKDPEWYESFFNPVINENNEIIGATGLSRNIGERKRVEAAMLLKTEELQKINAEKDKFFSIIAHDLRSPFNGFLGLTELMADGLSRMTLEDIQSIAVLMKNSAANLFRLLGNLLEWSRMQRGLATFSPLTFYLDSKIFETTALLDDAAREKEIIINYNIPEKMPVYADVNMFEGIIRNLVFNAIKFTPKGGNIMISANPIQDDMIEVSIKDSGIGMNQFIIDNLFRLDINTNRKGTSGEYSTGLGLILCKDFVERHGGKLWIESEEKSGSTFHFSLPSRPEQENPV